MNISIHLRGRIWLNWKFNFKFHFGMIKMVQPENMVESSVFATGEIEHGNGFSLVGLI